MKRYPASPEIFDTAHRLNWENCGYLIVWHAMNSMLSIYIRKMTRKITMPDNEFTKSLWMRTQWASVWLITVVIWKRYHGTLTPRGQNMKHNIDPWIPLMTKNAATRLRGMRDWLSRGGDAVCVFTLFDVFPSQLIQQGLTKYSGSFQLSVY